MSANLFLRLYAILALASVMGCTRRVPKGSTSTDAFARADSLVAVVRSADSLALERTGCFGACAAYRLVLTSAGRIRFDRRNRYAALLTARDSIEPNAVSVLLTTLLVSGFTNLPDSIAPDGPSCGPWATDHPTATVVLYAPTLVKRVADYHGCAWSPHALRRLQDDIDRAVGLLPLRETAPSPVKPSDRPHN